MGTGVSTVKANDVAALVFDPDASEEPAHSGYARVHVEDPGAHGTEELAAHEAKLIMLLIEPGRIDEHHVHEPVGIVCEFLQAQNLAQAGHSRERTTKEAMVLLFNPRIVDFVEERLSKINPAQNVIVADGDLVDLRIGPRVLNIGFHQRRALLDIPDHYLFLGDGPVYEVRLCGRERPHLLEFRLLFRVSARDSQGEDQNDQWDLSIHHVMLLDKFMPRAAYDAATEKLQLHQPFPGGPVLTFRN